jgi:CubicO group peptidase (beta-lactamase class C family)
MDFDRLIFVGALLTVTSFASSRSAPASPPRKATACPSDSAMDHRFLVAFRAALPKALAVVRGALVIVCDDRIVFMEGFGRTAAGDTVDPSRTLFRAASNSKLIAATAVMQLADQGLWRLDDDVNRYLPVDARLAPLSRSPGARPVTLAHLLTHTGGFEDRFAGGVVLPEDRLTLAQYFARRTPRRVTPPGLEVSYSNVGMALAGYLVEARTGEPFARYAEHHIFAPLGMTRSSFDQPPPRAWLRDLAAGAPHGRTNVVFNPYPAASLVATPADMGRFIAAHLGPGSADSSLGGGRILSARAMAEMHAPHWRAQPTVPAVAYGFFEGMTNGRRTLFHTGDSGDHSLVLLLPDEHVGLYFVFSGEDEQTPARDRLARSFMDTFFPLVSGDSAASATTPAAAVIAAPVTPLPTTALAGTYRSAAYSRSNFEKVRAMFTQVVVRPGPGTTLLVTPPGSFTAFALEPAGPLVFRRDSGEVIAFRQDSTGHVVGFTLSGFIWDPSSWDRVSPMQDGRLHLAALGAAVLLLGARALWAPVAWAGRRARGMARPALSPNGRLVWKWSGAVVSLFAVAPVIGAATALLSFSHPLRAVPRGVGVLTTLLLIAVSAGIALGPVAFRASRRRELPRPRLIAVALTTVASLALAVVLGYWNLLAPWSLR